MIHAIIAILLVPVVLLAIAYMFTGRSILYIKSIPIGKVGILVLSESLNRRFRSSNGQDVNRVALSDDEMGIRPKMFHPPYYIVKIQIFKKWELIVSEVTTIPDGQIGIVEAKYGYTSPTGGITLKAVTCNNFEDAEEFFKQRGEKGLQPLILKPGDYKINTMIFNVKIKPITVIAENQIGIVTALKGLPNKEPNILKQVDCDNYCDADIFFKNGGMAGLQPQILTAGSYLINTEVFSVNTDETITIIPKKQIGIVVAKYGIENKKSGTYKQVECNNFCDANDFFKEGGQFGLQPQVLTSGIYPINKGIFDVIHEEITPVLPNHIGMVEAFEGKTPPKEYVSKKVECDYFRNAQAFFDNDGEAGIQPNILMPNEYEINTMLFKVHNRPFKVIKEGQIGIVTALHGEERKDLNSPISVEDCDHFQNVEKFIANHGEKGVQCEVLKSNTYYINPHFFDVEEVDEICIKEGFIGVVNAKYGKDRVRKIDNYETKDNVQNTDNDETKKSFMLVDPYCENFCDAQKFFQNNGQKGIQGKTLRNGTYQINTHFFDINKDAKVTIVKDNYIGIINAIHPDILPNLKNIPPSIVECDNYQDATAFINMGGCQGFQRNYLNPGSYYINPEYFNVKEESVTIVPENEIGIVIAKFGNELPNGRALGKNTKCNNFEDANIFFENNGQRGPQSEILRGGSYKIIKQFFSVVTSKDVVSSVSNENAIKYHLDPIKFRPIIIRPKQVGIVECLLGEPLIDTIAAKNNQKERYEDADAFVNKGGFKGLQYYPLEVGEYYVNPLFAAVEIVDYVHIPADRVGVLISSYSANDGEETFDKSQIEEHISSNSSRQEIYSDDYYSKRLVDKGHRGVVREIIETGDHLHKFGESGQ
jgi:uncharacterized membrane protein YqiK